MNEAITIAPERHEVSMSSRFQPHDLRQMAWLANQMVKSGLFKVTQTQALAIMLAGAELGVMTVQALRSIYIIEGKPVLAADLMVALAKRNRGVCEYFRMVESTPKTCTYETLRVGDPSPTTLSVNIEDFGHLANKTNWRQNPAAMLRARCSSQLARAVYPDVFMGVYEPDEATEFSGNVIDVTPTQVQPAAPSEDMEMPPGEDTSPKDTEAEQAMVEAADTVAEAVTSETVVEAQPEEAAEPEKPKRGRPPKAAAAPQPQVIEGTATEVVAEAPAAVQAEAAAPAEPEDPRNTLGDEIRALTQQGQADKTLDRDTFGKMIRDAKIDARAMTSKHGLEWAHYISQDSAEILVYLLKTVVTPEEEAAELPMG